MLLINHEYVKHISEQTYNFACYFATFYLIIYLEHHPVSLPIKLFKSFFFFIFYHTSLCALFQNIKGFCFVLIITFIIKLHLMCALTMS